MSAEEWVNVLRFKAADVLSVLRPVGEVTRDDFIAFSEGGEDCYVGREKKTKKKTTRTRTKRENSFIYLFIYVFIY